MPDEPGGLRISPLLYRKDAPMKQKSPSRFPQFIRSIFLPRKSAVVAAPVVQSDRMPEVDHVAIEPSIAAALVSVLRVPNADAARDAAITLGKGGESAAVEPLIEVLENKQGFFHAVV